MSNSEILKKEHHILLKIIEAKNINWNEECDCFFVIKVYQDPTFNMASSQTLERTRTNSLSRIVKKHEKGSLKPFLSNQEAYQVFKTKTVWKSKTPWFDEEFEIQLSDQFHHLTIELYQKHLLKEKLLAQLILPKVSLDLGTKMHEEWYSLRLTTQEESSSENVSPTITKPHEFLTVTISHPQHCDVCKSFVWGIQHSCKKCSGCGAICHTGCAPKMAQNCGVLGQVRLKYNYTEQYILPISTYSKLMELMLRENFNVAECLGRVTEEREEVAKILVQLFEATNQIVPFLKLITKHEIQTTQDPNTIFRANSLASKSLDQFMKRIGMKYLRTTLQPMIHEILLQSRRCELDPTRFEKNENIEENFTVLEAYIKWGMDRILSSGKECPILLRQIFASLRAEAQEKFPNDANISMTVITAFIFLRFFNPAILGPSLFGLCAEGETPSPRNARTLTLISKTIQQLANMTPFDGKKEPYMTQLNHLVESNYQRLQQFLNDICKEPSVEELQKYHKKKLHGKNSSLKLFSFLSSGNKKDKPDEKEVEIDCILTALHRHLYKNLDKMKQKMTDQEKQDILQLEQILNDLSDVYEKKSKDIQLDREKLLKKLELYSSDSSSQSSQDLPISRTNSQFSSMERPQNKNRERLKSSELEKEIQQSVVIIDTAEVQEQ